MELSLQARRVFLGDACFALGEALKTILNGMNAPRPRDGEFDGMTVNERLVVAGIIEKWDDAVRRRCRSEMIAALRWVAFTETQAAQTADAVLHSPEKYGF
jgi:hypothetical protein